MNAMHPFHICGSTELPCYLCRARICREVAEMRIWASRAYPVLAPSTDRVTLTRWLQVCDGNGSHTDTLARKDRCDPHTLDSAWQTIAELAEVEIGRGRGSA